MPYGAFVVAAASVHRADYIFGHPRAAVKRHGTRILVSDRDSVVAELHEPEAIYGLPDSKDPILGEWIRTGAVIPPGRRKTALPTSPARLAEGSALRLLDEDRAESERDDHSLLSPCGHSMRSISRRR